MKRMTSSTKWKVVVTVSGSNISRTAASPITAMQCDTHSTLLQQHTALHYTQKHTAIHTSHCTAVYTVLHSACKVTHFSSSDLLVTPIQIFMHPLSHFMFSSPHPPTPSKLMYEEERLFLETGLQLEYTRIQVSPCRLRIIV